MGMRGGRNDVEEPEAGAKEEVLLSGKGVRVLRVAIA